MKKQKTNRGKSRKSIYLFILISALALGVISEILYIKLNFIPQVLQILPQETTSTTSTTSTYKLLVVGDIFLDRHIDELTQKDNKTNPNKYAYPFQGLSTLERGNYDAWVGNLECPVTIEQSSKFEKENWLKFSCKKEYLPELRKYFDIVSLANNHTDNMNGEKGLLETRKHLDEAGIKYFGHFDSSKSEDLCKLIDIENKVQSKTQNSISSHSLTVAFCGFHGVYKLPTDVELEIIKKYSDRYITIVMPHQGTEYEFIAGTYQRKIYRKMIDLGADVVIGSHPHVTQNVETYNGRKIFYSLGNFIFDQSWEKTRKHMVIDMEITLDNTSTSTKPKFSIKYTPIFTNAGTDFITRKEILTDTQYQQKLKNIGF
jgi:poly-gamma-glutamate synthesis protein (capsule biosynthesis protein)